jgi:rSAM/selenodomain-associated transferase 1
MKSLHVLDPGVSSESARGPCALAVMTKAPQAGQVKTRLVPPLTPEQAAALNKCFLRDTAAAISKAIAGHNACGIAVYTPIGAESAYDDIFSSNFSLLPQRGKEFGERLYLAAQDLFQCGFKSVCLIDSDSPTVSAENFAQAIKLLLRPGDRTVLGPCDDGGYYLIGFKKRHRELFERIDWSTERVLAQTMQRAREIGLEVKLLKLGYDVDDGASLRRMCNQLLADTASPDIAPHTRKFLRKLTVHKKL